ncbi:MAG TPA: sugar ABC transporter permease [Phycisphaerae bacterium]|nr:sugar ABC transporter permease [Phycisphaerae bacterium]HRY70500.1 sugar ABC transporter permease [Phycisphaerae bacterium]HSA28229.1 sugar ABC transporter permease [Phycisphaerae bacterium]
MISDRPRNNWRGYLFIAPATIYLAVFSLIPVAFAAYLSLHRWHLLKSDHPFVGWGNYTALAANPLFRGAVWNTLVYAMASVPLGVVSALVVAMLVSRPLKVIGVFRALYYIPAVCSQVALSMVWIWILLPEKGLISYGIRFLNLLAETVGSIGGMDLSMFHIDLSTDLLAMRGWAMAALVLMSMWIGLGPRMVIFIAGLQNIPETLYEAADLDGCNRWQRFWYVTLPQLAPTMLFVTVTTTIAAFQLFTPVYMMTQGGPQRTTDVVSFHIFQEAWRKYEAGMASAQSYVLFAMILVVAVFQIALMRKGLDREEAAQ